MVIFVIAQSIGASLFGVELQLCSQAASNFTLDLDDLTYFSYLNPLPREEENLVRADFFSSTRLIPSFISLFCFSLRSANRKWLRANKEWFQFRVIRFCFFYPPEPFCLLMFSPQS